MVSVHVITNCMHETNIGPHTTIGHQKNCQKVTVHAQNGQKTILAVQLSLVVSTLFSVKGLANQ